MAVRATLRYTFKIRVDPFSERTQFEKLTEYVTSVLSAFKRKLLASVAQSPPDPGTFFRGD